MLSLPGQSHDVGAVLVNLSLGGAFFFSERFLAEGSEFGFVTVFPPGTMAPKWSRALCRARVLRSNMQPVAGKFAAAVRFLNVQALP